MRLLIVQYAGDYREAYQRLANGGEETYTHQKYSVDYVADLANLLDEVTTICVSSKNSYDELLKPRLRAIGLGLDNNYDEHKIKKNIEQYIQQLKPTKLILGFPSTQILSLAINYQISTLAMFADYIENRSVKQKIKNYFFAKLLNHPHINWVSNHGFNSSKTLENIGVNPNKIIPWDFLHSVNPENFIPKNRPSLENENKSIFYCGSITETKGIGDVINAIYILKEQEISINLKIAGGGDIEKFSTLAKDLKVDNQINFLGLIPHNQIISLMRDSDLVVVPSRTEYPEGCPFVVYEGLTSRTPIVASNHPVFVNKLQNEVNAMIFASGDKAALANSIKKVLSNDDLYHKLSLNSYETWQSLQIPCKFAELIDHWLSDSEVDRNWLLEHNLSSSHYL
jgi:glycosyltransferase involved in cell wall biosynthesis